MARRQPEPTANPARGVALPVLRDFSLVAVGVIPVGSS